MNAIPHKNSFTFTALASSFVISAGLAVYCQQLWILAIPFGLLFLVFSWQHRELAFLLLVASLPFSFEYSLTESLGTDIPDEMLMWWVSFLFLIYLCYKPGVISKPVWQHPIILWLLTWMAWMMVATVFSTSFTVSVKYVLAKTWYIGAFVLAAIIVFRDRDMIRYAGMALVSSMILVMTITLYRHWQTGFSFASVNDAVSPFFRNHVNYSAMLVCVVPVMLAFIWTSRRTSRKIILLFMVCVAVIAIYFSYSRGAWLAVLAGAIAYFLIYKKWLLRVYIVSLVLALGALFWIKSGDRYIQYAPDFRTTIFHKNFNEHLVATYKLKDISTAERFYRWIAGVRMIKDDPVTGFGPNSFYDEYKPYAIPAYKTWVSDNPERSTVHNYFLLLAIEQGIPGLLFFVVLLGIALYYAQSLYHRLEDRLHRVIAMTVGVILVMITVLNSLSDLIETDKVGSLFFLCLALLVSIGNKNSKQICDYP